MKYSVLKTDRGFVVEKNGQPISLKGIGLLVFDTSEEAQQYIKYIYESQRQIRSGIPE